METDNSRPVFNFLLYHGDKYFTGREWANLLNVRVIDADGWDKDVRFDFTNISLTEFMTRVRRCTIM